MLTKQTLKASVCLGGCVYGILSSFLLTQRMGINHFCVCVCWILVSFISISIVLIKKEEGPLPFPLLLVSPLELVASTSLLPFLDLYCQRARQTQPDCWVYLWPVCPRRWAERHQRPTRGERQTGSHAVVQLWNT